MRTAPFKAFLFFTLCIILNAHFLFAQRVGIGTENPRATLYVQAPDSNLLTLFNSNSLAANVVNTLWFRSGSWYTGAIKTIGSSGQAARLSLFTFAAVDSTGLRERLSILDNGRVGIGTNTPHGGLEVQFEGASQLTLTNPAALQNGRTTSLFFRSGGVYTGAIKAVGTSVSGASLSFFTFASPDSLDQQPRMTVTNEGNVGIGTLNPAVRLDVTGNGQFTASGNVAAITGTNSGLNYLNIGVRGNSQYLGVVGQATANEGVGVAGYNLGGGAGPDISPGAGVIGYSRTGHGVFGRTTRGDGYAGVYGSAYGNGAVGGLFVSGSPDGFTNTLALRTVGAVRMTAIGEASGRVLTSDGSGNATWQPLPAAARGFSARLNSDANLVNGTELTVGNMTEIFDEGNIFASGTNSFTAPETGMYQVTFSANLSQTNVNNTVSFGSFIVLNGNISPPNSLVRTFMPATGSGTFLFSHVNTRLIRLVAGDVVTMRCFADFLSGTVSLRGGNFAGSTVLSVHQVK